MIFNACSPNAVDCCYFAGCTEQKSRKNDVVLKKCFVTCDFHKFQQINQRAFYSRKKQLQLRDETEQKTMGTDRRVARIWKRGGLFWKSEKSANDLDPNFDWSWISFTQFVRKFRRHFSESSEIQRFFSPKNRWSPKKKKKKKKGLRRNWDWFFGRIPKFKGFFRPKSGGLQKKKRSSPKLSLIFWPNSKMQTFQGGLFSYGGGGYFQFFTKNRPQRH